MHLGQAVELVNCAPHVCKCLSRIAALMFDPAQRVQQRRAVGAGSEHFLRDLVRLFDQMRMPLGHQVRQIISRGEAII